MRLLWRIGIGIFILNLLVVSGAVFIAPYLGGGVIAFTAHDSRRYVNTPMMIDTRTGIAVSLLDGIGEGDVTGRTPVWSQAGDAVAFLTFHNRRDTFVHEVQFGRYKLQNLTRDREYLSLPIYGQQDQSLFARLPVFDGIAIYLVTESNPDGRIIIEAAQSQPEWSPDGRYIVYQEVYSPPVSDDDEEIDSGLDADDVDIFLMDMVNNNIQNLTAETSVSGTPIWLPDSSGILFVASGLDFGDLYQININTNEITRLPVTIRPQDQPTLSPDGRYLAYTGQRRMGFQADLDVMILDLETYEIINISETLLYDVQPVWSADSRYLAYISHRHGDQDEIYIYDMVTQHQRRLTYTPFDEGDLNWRPR